MEDEIHEKQRWDNVINIQLISTWRKQDSKGEKQHESLPNYFLGVIWK